MRNFTFRKSGFFRLIFLIILLLCNYNASAQFYSKHYIAPAPWQYFNNANEIVIATNSTSTVTISVSKSDGTLITNLTATKGTPAVYRFSGAPSPTGTKAYAFNTVLNGVGLIVEGSAPVSINLRNVASDALSGTDIDKEIKGNAALTSFGDAGLGVRFRVGYYRDGSLGNFNSYGDQRPIYSIMATVNNTTIKINNTVTTTLNAGQSYLFKAAIGTLVESSNPIVMNTSAAIDTPGGCGDSAYNQIPPEAVLGTEYFLERGTGNSTAEQTTVVATKDNTVVKVEGYSTTGTLVTTNTVTLAQAGNSYTFVNGSNGTNFTASHIVADKRVAVYSGTAQGCEVDISTIAPVSECGGSNFIETAKFRNYNSGTLDYFGYILLRSATEIVTVNGTDISTISGVGARYQIGTTGWYIINFNSVQIGSPNFLSIASNAKLTVSIVQQAGGFSMAGFFSNFAAQPDDPGLTYISGGGCTNNTAELTTPTGFAPYQWYYNGTAISGANSATYTATKTGAYSVSSTLVCGSQTQSKAVNVTLCTDLGITKTVDNATPCIGSNVEFTVKVSNLGGNNVSGISVNDLLPSGYTYVSSTPSVGVYDSGTGTWTIGDVEAQTSMTLKIVATVNATGNYTNTASLPSAIDTNTANNSASAAVNPKTANLVITNPAEVCSPSTVDLTASAVTAGSSSNLTLSYWTNSTATSSYTTPTVATAGTYYIKAVSSDGCTFIKPVVVTVNSLPTTPVISVNSGQASCTSSGSTVLRSSGNASSYNGTSYLWSNGETTRSITITSEGTYSLKIINSSGCASASSNSITVTFSPSAPTASSQTFCSSENKKVSDLVATGTSLKWYNANTGGTQYASTAALATGTYYVSQTSANGCESSRTAVSVTVNSKSSAPVAAASQSFCAADNSTVGNLQATGTNIKWYSVSSNGTALSTSQALTNGDYYVSQTANSCGESDRTKVTVTINTVPSAPTVSPQTFCLIDNKKVSDLTPSGATYKWYSAATGGTLYAGTETLSSGNYFVSQSNSCGESARAQVVVTIYNTSVPTASSQTFCSSENKKVSDLVATGTSLKWYNASTGGTQYSGSEILSSGNYYVSQTLNGCESQRTQVAVTINNTAAPTASAQTFCTADAKKVSDLVATGTSLKWYNASTGGTQYSGSETLASGNYYVSQTLNNCESGRILVAVTVNPTPATPTISADGSTTFCQGGSVTLTSTGASSYLWSTGATTQSITVSSSGNYSVKVTNASGCPSAFSAATTVTVNSIPSAPTASAQSFCSADNRTVSSLQPSGSAYKWYDVSSGGTALSGTDALSTKTYYVSQTSNGCESSRASVSVTVNQTPAAPTASAQTFCSSENKKVSDLSVTSGSNLKWYNASTGGTLYAGTETLATGTYYVSQTSNGCESSRTSIAVTVTATPSAPTASAQSFCSADNRTVSSLQPSGSTYKWYDVSSGGTALSGTDVLSTKTYYVSQTSNGCESSRASVSVTVNQTPAAPTASAQTFCSSENKKVSDLSVTSGSNLKWYNASTGGTLYAGTEALATGTYYVSQTTNGCESARASVSVTVNPTPSAPTVSAQTFCSSENKKVSDLSPLGASYKWYNASTGGTLYAGTETLATGTYYVSQTTNGCESARASVSVTMNPTPAAPTVSAQTFCSSENKKVSDLSVTSGSNLKWYNASTGGTLYTGTETLATGTYYVSQTSNGCESSRTSVAVTVTATPSAPTASAQSFCSADNRTVNSLQPSGSAYKWYDVSSGGSTLAGTDVLSSKTYYVSETSNGCESARTSVDVKVSTTPSAPSASAQSFCSSENKMVNDLTASGTNLKWYNASSGGTALAETDALATGTYYVSQTSADGCESARTSVDVKVNTTPSAPSASAQTFCSSENKTVSDLTATGTNLKWYNSSSGGTALAGTDALATGTYYVSQTSAEGCESSRTSVDVKVNTTPSAPSASAQAFCSSENKTVNDLTATGTGLKWYNASAGGTALAGTDALATGTYYVSQTSADGCESARTSVDVEVNPTPSAPTASAQAFCSSENKTVNDLTASGTDLKWYNASSGGTALAGTDALATGTYYVSQTSADGCESARTSVDVEVNPTPSAPTASAQAFCSSENKTVSDLTATGTNLKWYNASAGGTALAGTDALATGTYYVSQTSTDGCESARTSVDVKVNPTPSAPSASAQTFCSSENKTVSDLTATGTGLKWYNASAGGTALAGTDALATGTYYVSQTSADGCESARTSVDVKVNPTPSAPSASAQTFCSSENKIVNDLTASGTNLKWYNASSGGTALAGTDALATGTYYVSQTSADGCESARTSVDVKVNLTPSAPSASAQAFCSSENKTVNDLTAAGTGLKWYNASAGGTALAGTDALATGTYYVSQTSTDGCESSRTSVDVQIYSVPTAPTLSAITQPTCLTATGSFIINNYNSAYTYTITPSTGVTNNAGTITAPTGSYTISVSSNGCASGDVSFVINSILCANDDSLGVKTSGSSAINVGNVKTNDTLNGVAVTNTNTVVTVHSDGVLSVDADGEVTLAANTPSGSYSITYEICEINSSNCKTATATVVVANEIKAVVDTITPINGNIGGTTVSLTGNDTLKGNPVVIGTNSGEITINIVGTLPTGLTLNTNGTITVNPNTPKGDYNVEYVICEVGAVPANCDSVVSIVPVTAGNLVANEDAVPSASASNTSQTLGNIFTNDTKNGNRLVPSDVNMNVTTADPKGYLSVGSDGSIVLAPNAPAGDYELIYTICEKLNPTNCSSNAVKVTVGLPVIDAVADAPTAINGNIGGTTASLTANDKLNGNPVVIGNNAGEASFTIIGTLPSGFALNPDYTITVAPNTPKGDYNVEYKICENTNPTNCDSVVSVITVTAGNLVANEDAVPSASASTTSQTLGNIFTNDTKNGNPLVPSDVNMNVTTADPKGYLSVGLDGSIVLAPNAPAGDYELTYTICEKLNPANCSSNAVKVTVGLPVIDAVADTPTAINGNIGGTTASLTANDKLNGNPVVIGNNAGEASFTIIGTLPAGLTLNPDYTITVAPNTPAGDYNVEYKICENTNPTNCDSVISVITVTAGNLVANEDAIPSASASNTSQTLGNIFTNDTKNGNPLVPSDVNMNVTAADPKGYLSVGSDGSIVLAPNAPAGDYELTYTICEKLNPTNCSSNAVKVTVGLPAIDAVADAPTAINGNIGGTTASLTANDKLNGNPVVIGNNAGEASFTIIGTLPAGLTLNPDYTITVAPNTPAGDYNVEYKICENTNPTNCDSVISVITVTAGNLVANEDVIPSAVGVNVSQTLINVFDNDTKDGDALVPSDVNLTVTTADPKGYLTVDADGNVVLAPNAPAGDYELTYTICEKLNTNNCSSNIVKVTVTEPKMTVSANSYCSNNVPYVNYSVTPDNFTTNNLLTVKWIDSNNNVVATQANLSLSGTLIWPGAVVDSNNNGIDWPGWILDNGQWIEGADGFEATRNGVKMEFSLNPTVVVSVAYPSATAGCNARPTFAIKANDDEAGPIDVKKGMDASINIFANDILNGVQPNVSDIILSTITANPNLVLNADGSINIVANTPSGVYELTYSICEVSNPSNCSQAIVKITVVNSVDPTGPTAGQITLGDDNNISVDGINGSLEFVNVLDNDLINGQPINPADVTVTPLTTDAYFEWNADGTVSVKPNTPGGNYTLTYQVCEKANPTNCSTAVLNVFVEVPAISVVKTAVLNDENKDKYANAGETITYKFTVTNTGNVPLVGITLNDPLPGVVVSGQAINLGVNESNETNFTAIYTITQDDINRGSVSNQASVKGSSVRGVEVEDLSDDSRNDGDNPTVIGLNGCIIEVLKAFSPNGDQKNSRFYIRGIECYPDNTVEIYNRWGVLVFNIDQYDNTDRVFLGYSNGRSTVKQTEGLPVGTYFYILKYKDSAQNPHEKSGYLYINK